MIKKFIFIIEVILVINMSGWSGAFAVENNTSIDLQNVSVDDALHYVAKMQNLNIVISPKVSGAVTLHLSHMPARQIFNFILLSQGLIKIKNNDTWLILPRQLGLQQQQDEQKLHEFLTDDTSLTTRVWQLHYAKAEELLNFIQGRNGSLLSKRGSIHFDARTNRLCVQDTQSHLASINQVIKRLDIPVQQVMVEVRLASVDSDCERSLGVNFAVETQDSQSTSGFALPYGITIAKLADGTRLDMQISALEKQGHAELISSPSLFTANQQAASIESGEEIPYQEVSKSGATAVAFKKAVLSLQVTPQVLPRGNILLQLHVNQDKPSNRMVLGVPAIKTRQISTNVLVPNGKTIVLGGIFESGHDNEQQDVPFLSKIPLVGLLFQQQNVAHNKRELLIFVTPRIIDVQ